MPSRAESILLARAQEDLDAGLAYKVQRIRASGHPVLARTMEATITGAVSLIQLRERFKEDVLFLCSLAHRCNAGEDPAKLAEAHVAQALRVKELSLVVREKDAAFPPLLDMARELMARRLPDLARMVAVPDPADYADLVRKAFPERAPVEALIEDNRVRVLAMVDHVARNPQLLRVPKAWLPKLDEIGRDMIEWQTARVLKGVDEIYSEQR